MALGIAIANADSAHASRSSRPSILDSSRSPMSGTTSAASALAKIS
jgi:hypothetical protein